MSLKGNDRKESTKSQAKSSADVQTKSATESKGCRFESKELPSRPSLPLDKSRSHWNKLKALKLQNNGSGFESIRKLSPEERSVWKNSKLFTKNMPAIDAMSSAKKANMSSISGVSRELSAPESHQKNITSSTNQNAISSKWATSQSPGLTAPAAKQSEWKLLKSKLNLLRRKGNKDFENCVETAIIGKDSKEATIRTISGKHERSAQISLIQSSSSPTESILCKRTPQEKGIICKKEDLMHIISEASKMAKLTRNISLTDDEALEEAVAMGLCASTSTGTATTSAATTEVSVVSAGTSTDVSIRRTALKKQQSCATFESSSEREQSKTKQSDTRTKCLDSCEAENVYKNQYKSKTNTNTTKTSDESVSLNSQNSSSNCESIECESRLKPKNSAKSTNSGKIAKCQPINECNECNESNLANT